MELDEQQFRKIEDYLGGKLPQKAAAAFEQEISQSTDLAELVDLHRLERESIEYLVEQDLQDKIKKWETEPPVDDGPPTGPKFKWWWGGVLLLALVGVIFLWNRPETASPSLEEVPATEVAPEPDPDTPIAIEETTEDSEEPEQETSPNEQELPQETQTPKRDLLAMQEAFYSLPGHMGSQLRAAEGPADSTDLQKGILAFQQEDYSTAIALLEAITPDESPRQYNAAQEWLGHAYLNNGNFEKAASVFERMTSQTNPAAKDRAEWYLVLSWLPDYEQNREKIEGMLAMIIDPEAYHNYASQGKELMEKLK